MKKQNNFQNLENIRLDEKIQKTLNREFPLPENVEAAKKRAFEEIRRKQEHADCVEEGIESVQEKENKAKKSKRMLWGTCAAAAAAAAIFSAACITHPTLAAQIPLVGHVFEEIGQSLGFSGDFSKYVKALDEKTENTKADAAKIHKEDTENTEENTFGTDGEDMDAVEGKGLYSETKNGMTVTLSEVYCNDTALYVSMVLQTEDKFPDTALMNDNAPIISLSSSVLKFSYNDRELLCGEYLDGKMIDEYTYAGVLRYNLNTSADNTDYDAYYKKRDEFFLSLGITQEELDNMSKEVTAKICEKIGAEELSDEAIAQVGGPNIHDYISSVEIPESFSVDISIPQIVGSKPDGAAPEMPEDIRAEYEQALEDNGLGMLKDNGLGMSDEEYQNLPEEQKELERQLFVKMWNAYGERYPDAVSHPNQYENWWVDGPWKFTIDVTRDDSQIIIKEINDVDENGLGLVSVTKTPFELKIEDGNNYNYFTVVLDANGDIMPYGTFGGDANVMPIQERDVSTIDIYICDYIEYMDELKGYYWSEDYKENKKTKTFKELLDERALYHKEISFEEQIS
ncbi:MAG: DUF4179 domain-containing protein [Eubacteriales bacterium]|nr:DUF4179 domain-containing protein [Eubacteriales bacterium]